LITKPNIKLSDNSFNKSGIDETQAERKGQSRKMRKKNKKPRQKTKAHVFYHITPDIGLSGGVCHNVALQKIN
jgi:hypothetical protein